MKPLTTSAANHPRPSNLRRVVLLVASVGLGAVGWFMLGDSEAASAVEPQAEQHVVARVHGVAITEQDLLEAAAPELRELEHQRHEILDRHLDGEVRRLLLEAAARERGVSPEDYLAHELGGSSEVSRERLDAFYERLRADGEIEILEPTL